MTQVTVVSVWHNREAVVRESLTSLLEQENVAAKYIIVDDGSTDGTLEALRYVARGFPDTDVAIVAQANTGFTRTIDRLTQKVDTPFLALHGAGDIAAPQRLSVQLNHAENTRAVVVGCTVGFHDGCGNTSEAKRKPRDCPQGHASPSRPPRPGTHGAAVIRTDAFLEAGGYRPSFRYSQDADLWFRLSRVGDFSGVLQLLYWKYVSIGVTVMGSPAKRLAQALYGELARQCEEDRLLGRPDLVERFGPDAIFLLRNSWRLRRRLALLRVDFSDLAAFRGLRLARGGARMVRSMTVRLRDDREWLNR
jgi:glycosyltransferase involved in cell wall biosynthesis